MKKGNKMAKEMAMGMAMGITFGTLVAVFTNNRGLWLSIGIGIGIGIAIAIGAGVGNSMQKKQDRDKSDKDRVFGLEFFCLYELNHKIKVLAKCLTENLVLLAVSILNL
jgi:hypothetical protein